MHELKDLNTNVGQSTDVVVVSDGTVLSVLPSTFAMKGFN
jgi:hypothetical protein